MSTPLSRPITRRLTGLAVLGPTPSSRMVLVAGGRVHHLQAGRDLTVGSGLGVGRLLEAPFVSGHHARFSLRGRSVVVEDLGSTNGTFVRGSPVTVERLRTDEAALLARSPVLVATSLGSHRYPDAVCWQGMVGRDRVSLQAWERLASVAPTDHPVWVWGPSGSGKEHAARAIHHLSARSGGPFVAVNCANLPPSLADAELFGATRGAYTGSERSRRGAFQRAHGGTLFLDEIGDLSPPVQAKLLRALESRQVWPVGSETPSPADVRIVTASWRDLQPGEQEGFFRGDLFFRLGVLRVDVPPLAARAGDVGPLLEVFLKEEGAEGLFPGPDLLTALERASWAGNVRQLRSHARRAAVSADLDALLPAAEGHPGPEKVDTHRLTRVLQRCGQNRSEAARVLGVSRSTVYRRLARRRGQGASSAPG